jgi:hypothetical protein
LLCCSNPTGSLPCMLPTYLTYGVQDHDTYLFLSRGFFQMKQINGEKN